MVSFRIGSYTIGCGHPCFVIAEAGVNHNGNIDLAYKLVDTAIAARADAVKFQSFQAEALMLPTAPKADYQKRSTGSEESQFEMIRRLELPLEDFGRLQNYCIKKGILFLSTPFDIGAVDYLAGLDVPAFKISSGEVTNHLLLEHVASKGKPIILSTGMCSLEEVGDAVKVIRDSGVGEIAILHCVSNYPASPSDVNLRAMDTIEKAFGVPVGYSDHTSGIDVPVAAVALGACIIEKHFTLDRNLPGPDHHASLEPAELAAMVRGIRNVECALGNGVKRPTASEADIAHVARRSLVVLSDIPAGARIEKEHLTALRPSGGIAPNLVSRVLGRQVVRPIKAGTVLSWEDLQ